jgi:DNA-binding LytR/AlgR family response regulator
MKNIEEILPQDQFCRVHRSYIVSLNHIDCFNGKSVTIGQKNFPLSEQYRNILLKKVITLTPEMKSREKS